MNGLENGAQPGTTPTGTDDGTDQTPIADAPADSSPATGAQADQSPTAADEFSDFKADVAAATGQEESPESGAEPENDPLKTDDAAGAEGKDQNPDDLSKNQDPNGSEKWTLRPEWQKLTGIADKLGKVEGKEARAALRGIFKQAHDLQAAYEKAKPAEQVVQEMLQSVGNSEEGFKNMRHLIRSFDSDPAGAIPMLKMLMEDCEKRAGAVLVAPELLTKEQQLQKQYDEGLIDATEFGERKAELLELQKARNVTEQQRQRAEAEQQRQSEQQRQAAITELNQTENAWTADKQKNDPDFPALQDMHGVYVQKAVAEFADQNKRWPNKKEATDLLEKAYKQAKAQAMKIRPRPVSRQPITSNNGSSINQRQTPTSEFEEFQADVANSLRRHR